MGRERLKVAFGRKGRDHNRQQKREISGGKDATRKRVEGAGGGILKVAVKKGKRDAERKSTRI